MLPIEDLKNFSRDFLSALMDRAGKQKDIVIDAITSEFAKFLTKINVSEEVRKILKGMTITLQASIDYEADKGHHVKKDIKIEQKRTTKRKR